MRSRPLAAPPAAIASLEVPAGRNDATPRRDVSAGTTGARHADPVTSAGPRRAPDSSAPVANHLSADARGLSASVVEHDRRDKVAAVAR
jgi:hypothetical protein